tara:strand:+ start:48 stop:242 length:195 start_codon:yes stop_codon:yes gene_type:complete
MKCSICKYNEIGEYGNNAEPINDGECCDWCNNEFVVPRRIADMQNRLKPEDDKDYRDEERHNNE